MEAIKKVLDSDAGFILKDNNQKEVIDNRFKLLRHNVDLVENKDDNFYIELIRLISNYFDKLYDSKIDDFPMHVFDENEDLIQQEYDELESSDIKKLCHVNRNLAGELFEYVCDILEKNKDIKLDREILTKLLNRNPKLFSLSVEQNYFYRNFDFERLVAILNKNETLKKSNISIDDIYQILVDTCQIDNEEIFGYLISSEDFQKNHQKIDEFLNECNGKAFADITNIIIKYFDKDYDRISIVKKRKEFSRNSNHFFT